MTDVQNCRLSEEDFWTQRSQVLSLWPTGAELDLEEAIAYHRALGNNRNCALMLEKALSDGRMLLAPRAGAGTTVETIEILQHLKDVGTADILPLTSDSYTRLNNFSKAQRGLEEETRLVTFRLTVKVFT